MASVTELTYANHDCAAPPITGMPLPHADERTTRRLRDALALVDIRLLDHIIIAGGEAASLVERGLR